MKPIITHIRMAKRSMKMFWGEATCFLTDIEIHNDTPQKEWSSNVINYNAVIQVTFDLENNPCKVYIEPLGEIQEPEEEQELLPGENMVEVEEGYLLWLQEQAEILANVTTARLD